MKAKFMFVGGLPSELVGLVRFGSFGQVTELDGGVAAEAARGGCVILPADDPAALAFTIDEWKKRASFGSHASAPAEFQAKVRAARVAAAAFAAAAERKHELAAHGVQIVYGKSGAADVTVARGVPRLPSSTVAEHLADLGVDPEEVVDPREGDLVEVDVPGPAERYVVRGVAATAGGLTWLTLHRAEEVSNG